MTTTDNTEKFTYMQEKAFYCVGDQTLVHVALIGYEILTCENTQNQPGHDSGQSSLREDHPAWTERLD